MNLEKCKMTKTIMLLTGAVAIGAICGCVTSEEKSHDLVVREDGIELRFVEVSGSSRLPIDFYFGDGDKSKLEDVTLPRYWVGERPITRAEYSKVMGLEILEGAPTEESVDGISWIDALHFVERLNEKYAASLPKGYRFSFPNVIEWLHATKVLELRKTIGGEMEFFIFTGIGTGMMLYTDGNEEFDTIPKRMQMANIGLMPVIVPIYADSRRFGAPYIARGETLLTNGLIDEARRYFELLLERGGMSDSDVAQMKACLESVNEPRDYDFNDWYDMLFTIGEVVSERGYENKSIVDGWVLSPSLEVENENVASFYERHGIRGGFMRVGDLPESVRADQTVCMNQEEVWMCFNDEDGFKTGYWHPSTNTLVQVLKCDFDGDGCEDMVVEDFASIGSGGYWYNFYRQESNGSYKNMLELQTVGLCAVPSKNSAGCAFVMLEKCGNPILMPELIVYKDGELQKEDLCPQSYYMLDAAEDRLYFAAPFIGAGYGLGWKHLQGRNLWQSPLYWPWKSGRVQGYEEARENAEIWNGHSH